MCCCLKSIILSNCNFCFIRSLVNSSPTLRNPVPSWLTTRRSWTRPTSWWEREVWASCVAPSWAVLVTLLCIMPSAQSWCVDQRNKLEKNRSLWKQDTDVKDQLIWLCGRCCGKNKGKSEIKDHVNKITVTILRSIEVSTALYTGSVDYGIICSFTAQNC